MDERDVREQRTEDLIQVRRVSQMCAAWTETERGAPGAFTLQLILDIGAVRHEIPVTGIRVDFVDAHPIGTERRRRSTCRPCLTNEGF